MLRRAWILVALCACSGPPIASGAPERWEIWIDAAAPMPVQRAADDVQHYAEQMGRQVERVSGNAPACTPGLGSIVFVGGSELGPRDGTDQHYRVHEERCDGGSRIELAGGGLLGRQYAAYVLLHRWGVRFFHPEQEYVPAAPSWPAQAIEIDRDPTFRWRSVSLHLAHPLELGDAFVMQDQSLYPQAQRYIDWQIKNGASRGFGGVGTGDLAAYGLERGFPIEAGFALHNQQQGGHPIIDPDDPRPEEEQIAAAIEAQMQRADGRVPEVFGFTFNPSEFTEIPDQDAVRQISFIATYLGEHYPSTIVETIDHGTHGEPTEHYGVRFYDLPQFAPPNLGVKVHTLMFYDLVRPAPVYGNRDFHFLYDFMAREQAVRHITYFPEAAWWLTFDIAVPLYLPITVQARDLDIRTIAWMLQGGLDGHNVFGTGHEWGYWQNEYCSLRMSMDIDYRWQDCFRDITGTMGDAAGAVQEIVEELVALQERDFFDATMLAYLVGSDPETEVAASVGVIFHPLPPAPSSILHWDAARVAAWQRDVGPSLDRMDQDYARLVERLRAIEPMVAEGGKPFFDEILDGIEATGLRARHAPQVYGALVTLRDARLRGDSAMEATASGMLDDADDTTAQALVVIARREQGYRYSLERSTAGGPNGDEDTNWTVYHYRYLNRTHTGFYYTRIDRLARDAFAGGGDAVNVSDAILAPADTLRVSIGDASFAGPSVDWGDGSAVETVGPAFMHDYAAVGVYPLHVTGRLGTDRFDLSGDVARVESEIHTGFSADITVPAGIDLVEPLLPSITLGQIDDARWAIGFGGTDDGAIALGEWSIATPVASAATFASAPAEIRVPVVDHGTGAVSAHLVVHDGVIRQEASTLVLSGSLDTDAVVIAVVSIGGFDMAGARRLVASTLGFTPDTLPPSVAFSVTYAISPP